MVAKGSESARVLIYDIENSPNLGWTWGKYEQNVLEFEQDWYLLSVAYKWLGDDEVHCVALPDWRKDYKADPTNDFRLAERLHALFDEADVCVGHNIVSFDNKKSAARLLYHGFAPPSPFVSIDTYLAARKYFNFSSNKLGDLCRYLGIGGKEETGGFGLWMSVMSGDKVAWEQMKKYNARDVEINEELYLRMLPWIEGHPNVGFLSGRPDRCPKCGSEHLTKQGFRRAKTTTRQQFQCKDCGGWCSSRIADKSFTPPSLVN